MNLLQKALSRLVWQYRTAEKFRAWISILPTIAQTDIEQPAQTIIDYLDIDQAEGVQLDVIGAIIGQDRPFINATVVSGDWFGWAGNPDRQQWGARWQPREAAGLTNISLPDTYYRILLRSRIAKNNSDATIDSMRQAIEYITGTAVGSIDDRQDMTFSVVFTSNLSIAAKTMIQAFDILPRPQGVELLTITEPVDGEYFGYIGDPNARPYEVAPYAEVLS